MLEKENVHLLCNLESSDTDSQDILLVLCLAVIMIDYQLYPCYLASSSYSIIGAHLSP